MGYLQKHWFYFSTGVLLIAATWIGLTALYGGNTTQGNTPQPRTGFLAPDFKLQTPDGQTYQLSELRGKVVILNLWASWCPPCKAEMPAIEKVYEADQSKGLVVLGVNMAYQDQEGDMLQFAQSEGVTFPILMDKAGLVSRMYKMQALPTTFFIDREGVIRKVVVGGPMSEALLRSQVLELLGEGH